MKERPILFNGAMVRATLDGSKTQTRRVCKPMQQWVNQECREVRMHDGAPHHFLKGAELPIERLRCPYGQPGDRLWVRETARCSYRGETPPEGKGRIDVDYKAGGPGKEQPYALADRDNYPWFPNISHNASGQMRWAPAIHMPRWASRITLEIVSVRVERLQAITQADAATEGARKFSEDFINGLPGWLGHEDALARPDAVSAFVDLWESTGGDWDGNPWVWAITFKRVTP